MGLVKSDAEDSLTPHQVYIRANEFPSLRINKEKFVFRIVMQTPTVE
jgi:hypothetical protein